MLTVNVLGGLDIKLDGESRPSFPKKGAVMIAFLAVENRRATREELASILWPHQQPDQQRHSLRNLLLSLKRMGLGESVRSDFRSVWLECFLSDYHVFIAGNDPDVHTGDFLERLSVDISEDFEDWLRSHRAQCVEHLRSILTSNAENANPGEAYIAARRLAAFDPLSEAGCRVMIRACARIGERVEALRAYERHATALRSEYGIQPAPETTAALAALVGASA